MSGNLNLVERMKELEPKKHAINTAICALTNPDEIKQFYQDCIKTIAKIKEIPEYCECIEYRVQFGVKPIHQMDTREVTNQFVGYILSAFDDETINRWKKVIPEIVCPTQWYKTFDWLFTHDLGFRKDINF
jgi:hypothetical protein